MVQGVPRDCHSPDLVQSLRGGTQEWIYRHKFHLLLTPFKKQSCHRFLAFTGEIKFLKGNFLNYLLYYLNIFLKVTSFLPLVARSFHQRNSLSCVTMLGIHQDLRTAQNLFFCTFVLLPVNVLKWYSKRGAAKFAGPKTVRTATITFSSFYCFVLSQISNLNSTGKAGEHISPKWHFKIKLMINGLMCYWLYNRTEQVHFS